MDAERDSPNHPTAIPAAPPAVPPLPRALTAPGPVIAVGTAIFLAITVITVLAHDTFGPAWIACVCGVGVGMFGVAVVTMQRRAVRRGARGAQRGLA